MSNTPNTATADKKPAEKAPATKKQLVFPREMILVNETPIPYVVARTHLVPGKSEAVTVKNEDELQRIKTDIAHLMALNGSYGDLDVKPLRITEAA